MLTHHRQCATLQHRKLDHRWSREDSQDDQLTLTRHEVQGNGDVLRSNTGLLMSLTRVATSAATQESNDELKNLLVKVLQNNLQIYDLVLKMQSALPAQVDRQQPVYFLDAFGYLSPMHLEFVNSLEAFLAVLEVRHKHAGLRKIQRGEYALEDRGSRRGIDLQRPWHACFMPGQKVDMSMIFHGNDEARSSCPGCQCETDDDNAMSVEWCVFQVLLQRRRY